MICVLTLQLEEVFSKKAKERMLSGNPVLKSEQGRTIETRKELSKGASVPQISAKRELIETRKSNI